MKKTRHYCSKHDNAVVFVQPQQQTQHMNSPNLGIRAALKMLGVELNGVWEGAKKSFRKIYILHKKKNETNINFKAPLNSEIKN